MSEIVLKNVCKTYDKKQYVVKDFSLTIEDGEFVIFVGRPAAANLRRFE